MITNLSIGHCGRLGNQIFQYAILKCISLKHGYKIVLPKENIDNITVGRFNPSINDVDKYRLDLLDCFEIPDEVQNIEQIKNKIHFQYSENFTMDYNPFLISDAKDNTDYNGFFQCVQYYYEFENEIKNCLKIKSNIQLCVNAYFDKIKKEFNVNKIITLHVRRGDLSLDNGKYQVLLSPQYYKKIINNLREEKTLFLLMSDDLKWCKQNFQDTNIKFCDISEIYTDIPAHILDFCVLLNGDKIIMSNSSFSWWAAWLSNAEEIYCPNRWFGTEYVNFHENNMRHNKWINIQYEGLP